MKYQLVQQTRFCNETIETIIDSPDFPNEDSLNGFFDDEVPKETAKYQRMSNEYNVILSGSIELFELNPDGSKTRLKRATYETKPQ